MVYLTMTVSKYLGLLENYSFIVAISKDSQDAYYFWVLQNFLYESSEYGITCAIKVEI